MQPPRLTSLELPARAFVPGITERPPEGWLEERIADPIPADLDRLLGCETFRYGFDLFHAGLYWEAHEAWETLWQVARKRAGREREARAIQVLIQIAASELQLRMGRPDGAASLARKAARQEPLGD